MGDFLDKLREKRRNVKYGTSYNNDPEMAKKMTKLGNAITPIVMSAIGGGITYPLALSAIPELTAAEGIPSALEGWASVASPTLSSLSIGLGKDLNKDTNKDTLKKQFGGKLIPRRFKLK